MFKLAAVIGGILLLAGVALAGAVTSLGSTNSPTAGLTTPLVSTPSVHEDHAVENEARGRAGEPGEDVGAPAAGDLDDDSATGSGHDAADDTGGSSGPGNSSDDGGHSGDGGGSDD